jgi:hypothetical protein
MELVKLEENVYYYKKVFENPQELINKLEKLEEYPDTHRAVSAWKEDSCDRFRKDLIYNLKDSIEGDSGTLVKEVIETLKDGIDRSAKAFVKDRGLDLTPNISPMLDMCKYVPGGSLGIHYDGIDGDRSLLYTIVAYFNDDYKGGQLSFTIMNDGKMRPSTDLNDPNIDFWIKPEPGSVVIFPSQEPYYHQAHEVTEGFKYMSTSSIFVEGYDPGNPDHVKKYRPDLFKGE